MWRPGPRAETELRDSARNPSIDPGQKGGVKGAGVFCETAHSSSAAVSTWPITDPPTCGNHGGRVISN